MAAQDTNGVEIVVNGDVRGVPTGSSVLDLLGDLGLPPDRVAIELNRSILPRNRWSEAVLTGGEHLEIVSFVGGG